MCAAGVVLIEVPEGFGTVMSPASASGAYGCTIEPALCMIPCDTVDGRVIAPEVDGVMRTDLCPQLRNFSDIDGSGDSADGADNLKTSCESMLPFDSTDADIYADDMTGCHAQFLLPVMALVLPTARPVHDLGLI